MPIAAPIVVLPVVAIGLAAGTSVGGQSFLIGSGVRWEDAYRNPEAAEPTGSGLGPELRRDR
jgi:hypothetical protein